MFRSENNRFQSNSKTKKRAPKQSTLSSLQKSPISKKSSTIGRKSFFGTNSTSSLNSKSSDSSYFKPQQQTRLRDFHLDEGESSKVGLLKPILKPMFDGSFEIKGSDSDSDALPLNDNINYSSIKSRPNIKNQDIIQLSDSDDEIEIRKPFYNNHSAINKHSVINIDEEPSIISSLNVGGQKLTSGSGNDKPLTKKRYAWEESSSESTKRKKLRLPAPGSQVDLITNNKFTSNNNFISSNKIKLSNQQEKVLEYVMDGKSVFYTGSAGTGKTILLQKIISKLKSKYFFDERAIAITAPTGLAAVTIGGTTINRFAGIGICEGSIDNIVKKAANSRHSKERWRHVKVLIIDEVSMVSNKMFTVLENIGRVVKGNSKPFGGIQIVLTGDFFQLPPVITSSNKKDDIFCFNSSSWKSSLNKTIMLTEVFRQKGDQEFIDLLNNLRIGIITPTHMRILKSLERKVEYHDGIEPTELYAIKTQVEKANNLRSLKLPGKSFSFISKDFGPDQSLKQIDKSVMAPKNLSLKRNTQVMLIKNDINNLSLVNGTLGIVIGFLTDNIKHALENFMIGINNGNEFFQLDSIYNSNDKIGKELLDDLEIIAGLIGNDGELSQDIQKKIKLMNKTREKRFDLLRNIARISTKEELKPFVKFTIFGTEKPCYHLVERVDFSIEEKKNKDNEKVMVLGRQQFPLILAWALSIHKAQGQTLDRVRVDLGKAFEDGQVYVALSRAVSRDRLEVYNLNMKKVTTSNVVIEFMKSLETF